MKLVIGLGNPGQEYHKTRHNVGFMVIDALAERWQAGEWKEKCKAQIVKTSIEGKSILLVKPITYMNLSGEAVSMLLRWYKEKPEEIAVVYDDMDLPVGRARIRKCGSSGGHRGMESIIANIGLEQFARIRIGVGRPKPGWSVVDHVLSEFDQEEQPLIEKTVDNVLPALESIIFQGVDKAMNLYNTKLKGESI